jgi:hypothetical protein
LRSWGVGFVDDDMVVVVVVVEDEEEEEEGMSNEARFSRDEE